PLPRSPPFPYTTLFRSQRLARAHGDRLDRIAGLLLEQRDEDVEQPGVLRAGRGGQDDRGTLSVGRQRDERADDEHRQKQGHPPRSEEHTSELQSPDHLV